jgi:hypothetical protein
VARVKTPAPAEHIPPQSRGTALGGFVAFQEIAYGLSGPITGVRAARAGYPSVFLVGAVATPVGIGFVFTERAFVQVTTCGFRGLNPRIKGGVNSSGTVSSQRQHFPPSRGKPIWGHGLIR